MPSGAGASPSLNLDHTISTNTLLSGMKSWYLPFQEVVPSKAPEEEERGRESRHEDSRQDDQKGDADHENGEEQSGD